MRGDWSDYILPDYDFTSFAPGTVVLDIGCGKGRQLQQLVHKGCRAVGIEPSSDLVSQCTALGLNVMEGRAENLPFADSSFDGIICKVVMPFTVEPEALREMSRVLKSGGTAQMCYQGAGYYLRYLLLGPGLKFRLYAFRTVLNTWLFAFSGKVLPGFLGDTIYQSARRLRSYYQQNSFELIKETPSPTFLGLPVFIYHQFRAGRAHGKTQGGKITSTSPK